LYQKFKSSNPLASEIEVQYDDVIAYLMYELQIEVVSFKSVHDVLQYLSNYSVALLDNIYKKDLNEYDLLHK